MRILDCKEKTCKEYNKNAPAITEYLCDECKEHFENVKNALKELNITLSPEQQQKLDQFYHLLVEWNKKINLQLFFDFNNGGIIL